MCSLCKHSGIASYYLRLWCFCHALICEDSPPRCCSIIYQTKQILIEQSLYIKTHGSESRGQEEAVRDKRGSYLHVALLKTSQAL